MQTPKAKAATKPKKTVAKKPKAAKPAAAKKVITLCLACILFSMRMISQWRDAIKHLPELICLWALCYAGRPQEGGQEGKGTRGLDRSRAAGTRCHPLHQPVFVEHHRLMRRAAIHCYHPILIV